MFLSRLAVLLLLPFLAAAIIPWLNAEATPRVMLVTLAWSALLHIFLVGMASGAGLLEADKPAGVKLLRVSVLALFVLWLAALSSYFALSPLVGVVVAVLAQLLGMKQFSKNTLWRQVKPTLQAFLARIVWVSIGCQLMLALSYLRTLGGI